MVSKSKRRREAKARAAQAALAQASAPAPKQKKRSTRKKRGGPAAKSNASSFVSCVLNPFGSIGMVTGVPDRFDGQSLMLENTTIVALSKLGKFESGKDRVLLIAPFLGCNVLDVSEAVDSDGLCTFTRVQASLPPVTGNAIDAFSSFRTVSLAVRITYVGKPLDASGYMVAAQIPLRIGETAEVNISTTTVRGGPGVSGNVAGSPASVIQTRSRSTANSPARNPPLGDVLNVAYARFIQPFSVNTSVMLAEPDAVMVPAKTGITAVAKHRTADAWDFAEIDPNNFYLTMVDTRPGTTGTPATISKDRAFGPIQAVDCGSYGVLVVLSGVSNADFMVECRHCVEAVPDIGDGIYRAMARPSPPLDRSALDQVVEAQRMLPTGSTGSSWTDLVKKAISGVDVRSIVKRMGHMFLGPAAAVLDVLL